MKTVRAGVIGLGFMGATHVRAYLDAARDGFACELVAVCDNKQSRRDGLFADVGGNIGAPATARAFDPARVKSYSRPDDLLADTQIDLVSICTPTDSHVDLAIRALRAGKHVLVEKPVALQAQDIRRVEQAARETGKPCMPAMCMRFWPGWDWLKQCIDDGRFGECSALCLTRIGSPPAWSRGFYDDSSRSGGALVDLHIHDADFICYCFGQPVAVTCVGTVNHVTTLYQLRTGRGRVFPRQVVAEGGWLAPGTPFRMRYLANFHHATADFDLGRQPQLMVYRNGTSEPIALPSLSGYDLEIRHLVQTILGKNASLGATLTDAIAVADVLDAERRSLETARAIELSNTF
jgi:predicted dehydrogenase